LTECNLFERHPWLIAELSRLGFSVTYDEVIRYKQSVLHDDSELQSPAASFPANFTQFVADNVHHNVVMLDGKGTFHGMGITAVSTKTEAWSENLRWQTVKRLKRANVMDVVNRKGVPTLQYHLPEKQRLSALSFNPVCHLLRAYTLPSAVNLDLLWSSGWLFPDAAHHCETTESLKICYLFNVNQERVYRIIVPRSWT